MAFSELDPGRLFGTVCKHLLRRDLTAAERQRLLEFKAKIKRMLDREVDLIVFVERDHLFRKISERVNAETEARRAARRDAHSTPVTG